MAKGKHTTHIPKVVDAFGTAWNRPNERPKRIARKTDTPNALQMGLLFAQGDMRCLYCGEPFVRHLNHKMSPTEVQFCSRRCCAKWRVTFHPALRPKELSDLARAKVYSTPRTCDHCGQEYHPTSGRQRWCPKCVPNGTARVRLREMGVSDPEWKAMLREQDGMCYLCGTNKAWALDHSHRTGLGRKPLCNGCNVAVGFMEKPGWTEKALEYLGVTVDGLNALFPGWGRKLKGDKASSGVKELERMMRVEK